MRISNRPLRAVRQTRSLTRTSRTRMLGFTSFRLMPFGRLGLGLTGSAAFRLVLLRWIYAGRVKGIPVTWFEKKF